MPHLLIISANFYEDLSAELLRGAEAALRSANATYDVAEVPGALEIPAVVRIGLDSGNYDGFVALGCVIRGETYHFEVVCNASASGLMQLAVEHGACIGNGILTVENEGQAWARARVSEGNKGGGAADAALRLITLKQKINA